MWWYVLNTIMDMNEGQTKNTPSYLVVVQKSWYFTNFSTLCENKSNHYFFTQECIDDIINQWTGWIINLLTREKWMVGVLQKNSSTGSAFPNINLLYEIGNAAMKKSTMIWFETQNSKFKDEIFINNLTINNWKNCNRSVVCWYEIEEILCQRHNMDCNWVNCD